MHYLQNRGQDNVLVSVCSVIILVNVATDNLCISRFFHSGKYTVSGTAGSYKHDVNALIQKCLSYNLSGSLIGEVSDIVSANIGIGHIGSGIGRNLHILSLRIILCLRIIYTGHKAVLVVYVGGISDTVYYGNLSALGL